MRESACFIETIGETWYDIGNNQEVFIDGSIRVKGL